MTELLEDIKKTRETKLGSSQRCPYIGLASDHYTVFSNPTQWNRCFLIKRAAQVALEHQTSFCLTPSYSECDVFKRNLTAALPKNIRLNQYGDIKRDIFLISLGLTLSVLFLIGLRFWLGSMNGFLGSLEGGLSNRAPIFGFVSQKTLTSTPTVTFTPFTPSPTPTFTPTPSSTSTPTATATPTSTPTATSTLTPTASPTIYFPTFTPSKTDRPAPNNPKPPTPAP